jgi:ABC-2 type transport system permease protein
MIEQLFAFLKKDVQDAASYKFAFFLNFIGIFFSVVSFFFISKLVPGTAVQDYGGDYFSFVLIGIALSNFLGLGLNGYAAIIKRMQTTGTIETVLSSRARLGTILFGSSIWSYFMTIFNVFVYFLFGILLFNMKINANIPAAFLVLILSSVCFSSIGIIAAAIILLLKRANPISMIFGAVSSLLAGTLYPISIMPEWLQKIAMLFPLTHALRAMRHAVIQNYSLFQLGFDILILFMFCLILLPVSMIIFRYALKRAKKTGSLIKY